MAITEWYLRSTRVFGPSGLRDMAVGVRGETISEVVVPTEMQAGLPVVDVGDLVVMPGFVDSHVHINEPGRTEWEGFRTATRAAAAGGITSLVDMPLNSIPVTTSQAAMQVKMATAEGQLWVDCGFWGGVVPGNSDQLFPMITDGILGFKGFLCHSGIDDFPNVTEQDLHAIMPILAQKAVPLLFHAELETPLDSTGDPSEYATFLTSRPASWEVAAIDLVIRLCREYRCPVHIVHLSAADALPKIAAAKAEGLPITVETCPHYLTLEAEAIPRGATACKCAPPIRSAENRERLWAGLKDGIIDFIVSDHSPCTPELKKPETGDFMAAWGGIASVQFSVSLVWTEAKRRGFGLADLHRWMCQGPSRFAGLSPAKGMIATGFDADLVVWDPDDTHTVAVERIEHRHPITPYLDRDLSGVVDKTYVRGQKVYDRGTFAGLPIGKLLRRLDA
ncbi:MAG: allantoinase AllB [Candidatus Sericytochromatia bacterium]|nr:allantoinase AllB [Candidatus Sericytochromatia bacterium]